jgi:hypothetical protein
MNGKIVSSEGMLKDSQAALDTAPTRVMAVWPCKERRTRDQCGLEKRRKSIRTDRPLARTGLFLVALMMIFLLVDGTKVQAAESVYFGKFILVQQIHWGRSVLRPGHYTMAIVSSTNPVIVKVQNEETGESFRVATVIREEKTTGSDALLLHARNGELTVHSLSLPEIGMVLIYEPGRREREE